jgi:hypothetical protein
MRARRVTTAGLVALGILVCGGLSESGSALAAAPETPVSRPASGVTATGATLNGELNPGAAGEAGEYDFEYSQSAGECTPGSLAPEPPGLALGAQKELVSTSLTGLEPSKPYTFCVVASHEGESSAGGPVTFETLGAKPAVDSESNSGVNSTDATLEAQINPNNQESSYVFEYATNEALTAATTVPGASLLAAEFGDRPASAELSGVLQPATTYYYRAVATNGSGPTQGALQSFTTLAAPALTTAPAQNVTRASAVFSGTVDPEGAETTYRFAYIDEVGYKAALAESAGNPYAKGEATPETKGLSLNYTVHPVGPFYISELRPGTVYHAALVATNSVNTTIGPDVSFTTSAPTPPLALTGASVKVTQLSATLTGTVDTRGLPTTLGFEFGTTPSLRSMVPASLVPGSESGTTVGVSASFGTYLLPGVTYYYRLVATNPDGTSYGAEQSFATAAFPAAFAPAAGPAFIASASIAQLNAKEAQEGKSTRPAAMPLTKAQKLAKALKACTKKPKRQRATCQRRARKQYGPTKKTAKAKGRGKAGKK